MKTIRIIHHTSTTRQLFRPGVTLCHQIEKEAQFLQWLGETTEKQDTRHATAQTWKCRVSSTTCLVLGQKLLILKSGKCANPPKLLQLRHWGHKLRSRRKSYVSHWLCYFRFLDVFGDPSVSEIHSPKVLWKLGTYHWALGPRRGERPFGPAASNAKHRCHTVDSGFSNKSILNPKLLKS